MSPKVLAEFFGDHFFEFGLDGAGVESKHNSQSHPNHNTAWLHAQLTVEAGAFKHHVAAMPAGPDIIAADQGMLDILDNFTDFVVGLVVFLPYDYPGHGSYLLPLKIAFLVYFFGTDACSGATMVSCIALC
jgi:hypothetical protein